MIDRRTFLAGLGATAAVAAAPVAFAAVPSPAPRGVISAVVAAEPWAPDDLDTINGSFMRPRKVFFNVLYDGEFCGFKASPGDCFVMDCQSDTVSRA